MEGLAKKMMPGFSARRPLLGVTILLVEDSRYCSEAVRMMSQRSGSRLRRADTLRSARRHLAIYRPDVVMIDLGLPDGSGVDLIRELGHAAQPAPGIIALSGDGGGSARTEALEQGASCFLAKPLLDLQRFQQMVRGVLDEKIDHQAFIPQVVGPPLKLDKRAFVDDLGQVEILLKPALSGGDCKTLRYLAQFTRSVAQTAQDHELVDGASAFMARLRGGGAWQRSGNNVLRMVERRLADIPAI